MIQLFALPTSRSLWNLGLSGWGLWMGWWAGPGVGGRGKYETGGRGGACGGRLAETIE